MSIHAIYTLIGKWEKANYCHLPSDAILILGSRTFVTCMKDPLVRNYYVTSPTLDNIEESLRRAGNEYHEIPEVEAKPTVSFESAGITLFGLPVWIDLHKFDRITIRIEVEG